MSHELFPLFGVVVTVVVSLHYYLPASNAIQAAIAIPPVIAECASFLALVVVSALIVKLIKMIVDKVVNVEWHPLIERGGGFIVGIGRSLLVASVVLMILAMIPLSYLQRSIRDRSLVGMHILRLGPDLYGRLSRLLPAAGAATPAMSSEELVTRLTQDKSIVSVPHASASSADKQSR